jgi:tetratricopeptide (TPR) repeat protein
MTAVRTKLYERYELGDVLGRGGMGVLYRAYDRLTRNDVALKTLADLDNPQTIDIFFRDYAVLASMVHPNIVSILDIGEFDENGIVKPFFTMPLLTGSTLDRVVRSPNSGLTVERVIEIVAQAGRGLQAAHEMGLVHRDIKPGNIFVMDDWSVKVIDFGIPPAPSTISMTVLKGTVSYMAPEQLNHKPATPLSDLYSLAVVCYETLTARRPFEAANETDLADAIMRSTPPPVSDINPGVRFEVGQVIRKAMARQPGQRFPGMRDFVDALSRATRGEAMENAGAAAIQARVDRATQACDQGDVDFASEMLSQIESEGYLNESIAALRRRLDDAATQTRVRQLLDSANRYLQAQEYPLALRKVQDALQLDPQNPDALLLQDRVEKVRIDRKVEEWLQAARVQIEGQSFHQAREALSNALKIRPDDPEVLRLLSEVTRREQDLGQTREQKAALYEAAAQSWERGDVSTALARLESLMELERAWPDAGTGRDAAYQNFYQQVRSEHEALQNSYADARRRLESGDFEGSLALCRQMLSRYPNEAMFRALQMDAEQGLLRPAAAPPPPPPPPIPQTSGSISQERQELVQSVLGKARFFEEQQRFAEAHDQLQIIKAVVPEHPGIDAEIDRIKSLRDGMARNAARDRYAGYIASAMAEGDYARAQQAIDGAFREFPGDPEFGAAQQHLRESQERAGQALVIVDQARAQSEANRLDDCLVLLQQACQCDNGNPVVRTAASRLLLDHARWVLPQDPNTATRAAREALNIDPNSAEAQAMLGQIAAGERQEFVDWCISQAHRMRGEGDSAGGLALARMGLASFPDDPSLRQLEAVMAGRPLTAPPQPDAGSGAFAAAAVAGPAPALASPSGDKTAVPQSAAPQPPVQAGSKRLWLFASVGAFVVIALLAAGVEFMRQRKFGKSKAVPGAVNVALQASPAGAMILVDGKECGSGSCVANVGPGSHTAEARLEGYTSTTSDFNVPAGGSAAIPPVQLSLSPMLPVAVVTTNLAQANVTLDQGEQQQVQNGELQLQNLAAGQRSIRFTGEGAQGVVAVTVQPAAAPRLDQPIQQQNLDATAVTILGGTAKVMTTLAKADVTLDGKLAGKSDPAGISLNNLAPGAHELVVTAQNTSHRLTFTSGPAPAMAVFFGVERNQGVLRVSTGSESNVAVFVNGVKFRRATQSGRLMLYLEPKVYKIRVEKEGFQPVAEQSIEVKRGAEAKLDFTMTALPQAGTVLISHAPAGADVTVDGAPAGRIRADGTLQIRDLKAGAHSIAIKKESFKPVTREVTVTAGRQSDVEGALQAANGTIKITMVPQDVQATVTWKREGEDATQPVAENPLPLPEGTYTIIGRAPDHEEARTTAKVTAGHAVNAVLIFKRIVVEKKEPVHPRSVGSEELGKAGFANENGSMARIGGNIVILPATGGPGAYTFQALMTKGKRLEWVADYADARNYIGWELNDDHLERYEMVDNKKTNTAKPKLRVKLDQWIQVTLEVTPTLITVTIKQDAGSWSDRISREGPSLNAGQSLARGRFGFRIPGKDKLVVGTFAFTPK